MVYLFSRSVLRIVEAGTTTHQYSSTREPLYAKQLSLMAEAPAGRS